MADLSQQPNHLRILAIDPGERVGWARGTVQADPDDGISLRIDGQGVHELKDFAIKLYESITNYDVVIYETWRLYPGMAKKMIGNDMQPSQLVGMIRLLAWVHPDVKLVSLGATVKNTAIKTQPDWLRDRVAKSTEEHDKDALHLLWYYYWKHYVT